ncbi:hypothetical protein LCGC14_0538650 [marine sediment metagenome]|uniref:Uncharacterized protein n=1 Tax=marine sediment metagenome TaxID=412755 RepID=A0A0F9RTL7_9ZZZZ
MPSGGGSKKKIIPPPIPDPIPTAPTTAESEIISRRAEAERKRRAGKKGRTGTILTGPSQLNELLGEA